MGGPNPLPGQRKVRSPQQKACYSSALMNILFISSEVVPFSKTGGLGDVAGALPAAMAALGHHVKVVTPLYGSVKTQELQPLEEKLRLRFPFGEETVGLRSVEYNERHEVLFLDHPHYFGNRSGIYGEGGDYPDNHRRFGLLSIGALTASQVLGFEVDIVHLNDWQTGLAAVALRRGFGHTSLSRASSVFTIHNLAYQGMFRKEVMDDLGLPWDLFRSQGLEFHDAVNFLKAGLWWSDALTTVSRRYAQEIQGTELGCNLDGLLRTRRNDLHGILNGVDYAEWDPASDHFLPAPYSAADLGPKRESKRELLRRFGLPSDDGALSRPLFGVVSRLAGQKGIDLLLHVVPQLLHRGAQFVILGSGDPQLEHQMHSLAHHFPHQVGIKVGFDLAGSHLVEAGSDFFVMPSRYEPCGLNQMYSLRYGTVPVVRATGGLDDTVVDLSQPGSTGIKFGEFHPGALNHALHRAVDLFWDPARLEGVRQRGMAQDFSWEASARKYQALFQSLIERRQPHSRRA